MHVTVLRGPISNLHPVRTFTDGQLFSTVSAFAEDGSEQHLTAIFCTSRLLEPLQSPGVRGIYVWRNHVFAVETDTGLVEDIAAIKRSYLYRDVYVLMLMTASVVLAPYALWVIGKKVFGSISFPEMTDALRNA